MKQFVEKHQTQIKGTLSCFDRLIFRGYLPFQHGCSIAAFLNQQDIEARGVKGFLLEHAATLKAHAVSMAAKAGRPYRYLEQKVPMERTARELAQTDGVDSGLICVFAVLEPCWTFSFRFEKGTPFAQRARRKCLHLYYYFMDPEFGLVHVKIQTWFPLVIQVYVNGREWLARKLAANAVGFTKLDNVFFDFEDIERAQAFADRLPSLDWPTVLDRFARQVNPLMDTALQGLSYYWVMAQSEHATDVIFKSQQSLKELYPRLVSHGMIGLGAKEVMSFLGRKLVGQFQGEIITDVLDLARFRIPGVRIKHRGNQNWLKMYDKAGIVLRVEMVINNPEDFRVRRHVERKGEKTTEWVQMRKGVAYLFRYRDVSLSATSRYLDAMAVVSDPTAKVGELDRITRRATGRSGRPAKALNPMDRDDIQRFQAVMNGDHCVRGFNNRDVRAHLDDTPHLRTLRGDERRQSAKVTRILHRLHAHGLIAKIPRSRRWRTTEFGRRVMATALQVRELNFPQPLALAA